MAEEVQRLILQDIALLPVLVHSVFDVIDCPLAIKASAVTVTLPEAQNPLAEGSVKFPGAVANKECAEKHEQSC